MKYRIPTIFLKITDLLPKNWQIPNNAIVYAPLFVIIRGTSMATFEILLWKHTIYNHYACSDAKYLNLLDNNQPIRTLQGHKPLNRIHWQNFWSNKMASDRAKIECSIIMISTQISFKMTLRWCHLNRKLVLIIVLSTVYIIAIITLLSRAVAHWTCTSMRIQNGELISKDCLLIIFQASRIRWREAHGNHVDIGYSVFWYYGKILS